MFAEDELLPISALQHLLFCERQCALIHLERQWAQNRLTVEGQHLHRRAHERKAEQRAGVHIVRGLSVRSLSFGLIGQTDVVEFIPLDEAARDRLVRGGSGLAVVKSGAWRALPIEYKRGRPKKDDSDRVQLCAQALCLEEMLGIAIDVGALFYGKRRRRTEVRFDDRQRDVTRDAAARLQELIASRRTPPARREPKCDNCSLISICLPDVQPGDRSMALWFDRALTRHLTAPGPESDSSCSG